MSISGMPPRSGLRKRSKRSSCWIGSTPVIPRQIGDEAVGGAAAAADADAHRAGRGDDVVDAEEELLQM